MTNKIEEQFVSYQVKVIPPEASETQVRETERAFYAGAIAVMSILFEISAGHISFDEGQTILREMDWELRRYAEKVMEDVMHGEK